MVLVFIVNVDWFFVSHRLPIALAAMRAGHKVHIATGISCKKKFLTEMGFYVHELPLLRGSFSVFSEAKTFFSILRVILHVKPDVVHAVTIKPVLYVGFLSRFFGKIGYVASISGLGYIFTAKEENVKYKRSIIELLYKQALAKKNKKIIFQNKNDESIVSGFSNLKSTEKILIPGSGVDLSLYYYNRSVKSNVVRIVMASRLLEDKGVLEFVEAAKAILKKNYCIDIVLAGTIDPDNPASIDQSLVDEWKSEEGIHIYGHCDDIPKLFGSTDIVVLPSYREGFPKVLIEAAASACAIVTTNVPGCRDAIIPDETGLLVPPKDADALAVAIERLIDDKALRENMGKAGRKLAEERYDINDVIETHMNIYRELTDH